MNLFLNQFAQAINQPPSQLTPGQLLRDIPGWDSLAILITLAMVDQEYGVLLNGSDLQRCSSVEDLYRKVMELKSKSE